MSFLGEDGLADRGGRVPIVEIGKFLGQGRFRRQVTGPFLAVLHDDLTLIGACARSFVDRGVTHTTARAQRSMTCPPTSTWGNSRSTPIRCLEDLFAEHGTVTKAQVITDRETGRSRGFGFVEMGSDEAAERRSRH